MPANYEEIMEFWKTGEFFDVIKCFGLRVQEGLLSQREIESFKQNLAKVWELVELERETNAEVIFNVYEMLKKARNWDDERLCEELKISGEAIEDIKKRHKPRSEEVGLKMLYELLPQMAV
jgi:hypothetical protein